MKGQSLIEVLLGFAVASIVITAIVVAVISSLNNAQRSRSQNTATQYSQQALEVMRQFRNNDVDTFRTFGAIGPSASTTYCFDVSCTKLSSISGPPCGEKSASCGDNLGIPGFTREIQMTRGSTRCLAPIPRTQPDEYYVRVEAFTRWQDGQCSTGTYCHEARFFACLN